MASYISLFRDPDLHCAAKGLVRNLGVQLRRLERGFGQTRVCLQKAGSKPLKSSVLDNTKVFARAVNSTNNDHFRLQAAWPSLADICFCSISFEARRIPPNSTSKYANFEILWIYKK